MITPIIINQHDRLVLTQVLMGHQGIGGGYAYTATDESVTITDGFGTPFSDLDPANYPDYDAVKAVRDYVNSLTMEQVREHCLSHPMWGELLKRLEASTVFYNLCQKALTDLTVVLPIVLVVTVVTSTQNYVAFVKYWHLLQQAYQFSAAEVAELYEILNDCCFYPSNFGIQAEVNNDNN